MDKFNPHDFDDLENESEIDYAAGEGFNVDDDGNWHPMSEEEMDAYADAIAYKERLAKQAEELRQLKEKYKNRKPEILPEAQWGEAIKAWLQTDDAKQPFLHVYSYGPDHDIDAFTLIHKHLDDLGFSYVVDNNADQYEIGVKCPVFNLDCVTDIKQLDEVLATITIKNDVIYRDGLPAPVYQKYTQELEEYNYAYPPEPDPNDDYPF